MPITDAIPLALRALAERPSMQPYRVRGSDGYLAQRIGELSSGVPLGSQELMELIWILVTRGLAYIDMTQSSPDYWTLQITERGRSAVADANFNPDNVPSYLKKVTEDIPGLSEMAKLYLNEALRSYSTENYLAATMMLGVTTEAVFYDCAAPFAAWTPDGSGAKLRELLEKPNAAFVYKFGEFQKRLLVHKSAFPQELAQNLDLSLNSLVELIRLARNDVGHPTGIIVTRETCFQYLVVFPLLAGRLYAIKLFCV